VRDWRRAVSTSAAALVTALAVGLAAGAQGTQAAEPPRPDYAASVDRALQTLRDAPADDRAASSSSAFVPEPSRAHQAVRDILAQPQYSGLGQGQSLGDRIRDALLRALVWVLEHVSGTGASGFLRLLAIPGLVVAAAVAVIVVRSTRWSGRRDARTSRNGSADSGGPAADRFAAADRLAAAGDLEAAIRALAGAVAVTLGGDRAWEVSPLTVRELFSRAADPEPLRPLLLAFEAAVYGERPPDAAAYRLAAAAAAPFRAPGARTAA
jgi:hypothetical protein